MFSMYSALEMSVDCFGLSPPFFIRPFSSADVDKFI